MILYKDIVEARDWIRRVAEAGDPADALRRVADLVEDVRSSPRSLARVFGSAELDALCQEIGRKAAPTPPARRADLVVFLVTSLDVTGGHSRFVLDLINAAAPSPVLVLVSDIHNHGIALEVFELFRPSGAEFEVAPRGDHAEKMLWLQSMLANRAPSRTVTVLHPNDAPAVAAVQPELTGRLNFIHNSDHNLALGVHLPHAEHVDHHAKGYYDCRENEGVVGNVLWPLVVADPSLAHAARTEARPPFKTCCCGGKEKFDRGFLRGIQPYRYQYAEVLPVILQAPGGEHVHIGPLAPEMLEDIRGRLSEGGIAPERFIYEPYVANLAEAFLDKQIDVCIGSFPLGGGRTCVEAMAAGLPLVIHSQYQSPFLSVVDEVYPGAMIWRSVEQLVAQLQALDAPSWRRHALASRAHYEAHHTPERLQEAFRGRTVVPNRPVQRIDRLQAFLDLETSIAHLLDHQSRGGA